ncbi:zinc metallopeptidase [Lutispora saccharofermentans]|uniref:Zinc metallopeptidase n=1 Tax=Lutispora saccharofermentans TaxID=3024236 RepID=A0ABT1N9X8_9FIRM|nr:zinc metallopeptidase [Lutispora saccharofermentans]MCQ1528062.1 zinc metallopeptidase [Lutispora saccharofermentans]
MFYGYGYYDPTFILLIPAMAFAFYAQTKISSTFNKFLRVRNSNGYTGYEIARRILDANGLYNVPIEQTRGHLTDHYDPRTKVLRLSQEVYNGASLASAGVAAHECGHAIQHSESYAPLTLRNTIAPIASIGSQASWFLIIIALALGMMNLFTLGIYLFSAVVLFQIVTLPVEYNASKRAIIALEDYGLVGSGEVYGAKKVLSAAALTYVAATLTAVLQLLRLLLIRGRRD